MFKNVKTKKVRHEENFGYNLVCEEVETSKLIPYCLLSFLFWTLYKQAGVVIQFHIKKFVHMGWINKKKSTKKKKKTNYAHF